MGTIIVIASGKGGTGKTTTVAAVASCLAALGHSVLAVDFDAGLRNLDISLGMSDFAVADLADVTEGRAEPGSAAREHPRIPGLFFLSAPPIRGPEELDADAVETFLAGTRERYDYILVDAPAGLGAGFRMAARAADEGVLVATEDGASIRDASRAAEVMRELGLAEPRLLINRVSRAALQSLRLSIDDIVDIVGTRLIGIVREDLSVPDAAGADTPLILHVTGGAARDFLDAARRLRGEELPIA